MPDGGVGDRAGLLILPRTGYQRDRDHLRELKQVWWNLNHPRRSGPSRSLDRAMQEQHFERILAAANGPALSRLAGSYHNCTLSDRDDLLQEIAFAIWQALLLGFARSALNEHSLSESPTTAGLRI